MDDVAAQGQGIALAQRLGTDGFDSAAGLIREPTPQNVVLTP
jgi:hypothetical protein